jgi:phosphoglycerol transferase MdoB-like AlkP superfamily enzyme
MLFAHVLFPHSPFVYLGDCSINYEVDKEWRFASPRNTPESRGKRYILYLEQSRCALSQLTRFFDQLREIGIYDRSIVLVHGDHGSTIFETMPTIQNEEKLIGNDYLDGYSTLFAIKMPHDEFQTHENSVSLSVLIHNFASGITGKNLPEPDPDPFVYLPGRDKTLKRKNIDIFSN